MRRLIAVAVLVGGLGDAPAHAQDAAPGDAQLQRIRKGLAATPLLQPAAQPEPTFTMQVVERALALRRPPDSRDYSAGPPPPGGLYAFEQRRQLGNPWAGQALVTVDLMAIARRAGALNRTLRDRAAKSASREVAASLAGFCAAQGCGATLPAAHSVSGSSASAADPDSLRTR